MNKSAWGNMEEKSPAKMRVNCVFLISTESDFAPVYCGLNQAKADGYT